MCLILIFADDALLTSEIDFAKSQKPLAAPETDASTKAFSEGMSTANHVVKKHEVFIPSAII